MTEILLFHHALGLTPGITEFAGHLRGAGHTVHTPDLYDGHTFRTVERASDSPGTPASAPSWSAVSGPPTTFRPTSSTPGSPSG